MKWLDIIENQVGKIAFSQIEPIEAYSNTVLLHTLKTVDGSFYKYVEKIFLPDEDYPHKKLIDMQMSNALLREGYSVPAVVYAGENSVVYDYIPRENVSNERLQTHIIDIINSIHSNKQLMKYLDAELFPYRTAEKRITQIEGWSRIISDYGLEKPFCNDGFLSIVANRDSRLENYCLTLRDCGTHNAIFSEGKTYIIDFERASYSHPADDLASLIVENVLSPNEILTYYFKQDKANELSTWNSDFKTELLSSLLEKSLEILVFFRRNNELLPCSVGDLVIEKYSALVDTYCEKLERV